MTVSQYIPTYSTPNSGSFKFKAKITGRTPSYSGTKNVEIVIPSKM